MSENFVIVLFIVVFLYISYREFLAKQERGELSDRLMSKDLPDFKASTQKTEKPKKEKPSPFVDIDSDEAREDLL